MTISSFESTRTDAGEQRALCYVWGLDTCCPIVAWLLRARSGQRFTESSHEPCQTSARVTVHPIYTRSSVPAKVPVAFVIVDLAESARETGGANAGVIVILFHAESPVLTGYIIERTCVDRLAVDPLVTMTTVTAVLVVREVNTSPLVETGARDAGLEGKTVSVI